MSHDIYSCAIVNMISYLMFFLKVLTFDLCYILVALGSEFCPGLAFFLPVPCLLMACFFV